MRVDLEKVFLRVEARQILRTCQRERCPCGVLSILANDTPLLEEWDRMTLLEWRARHGLVSDHRDLPIVAPSHQHCGVGG